MTLLKRRVTTLLAVACLGYLFVSCASNQRKGASSWDPQEEKLLVLQEEIKDQKNQIEKLTALIEAIGENFKPEPKVKKPKLRTTVLPKKSIALGEENLEKYYEDKESYSIDVADSTHEVLHIYYDGMKFLNEKKYEKAVRTLREFIELSPNHVYADRAQFLIAEAHLLLDEPLLVVAATNVLESKYPYSTRLADSIFRRGLAYQKMGERERAKDTFKELLKRFPLSAVADQIPKKLAELSDSPPPMM